MTRETKAEPMLKETQDLIQGYVERLRRNDPSFDKIYLWDHKITNTEAKEISDVLKGNKSLTEINLVRNRITDAGVKEIAGALEVNKGLMVVNLGYNNITDIGAKAIARALEVNESTKINKINLGFGDIGAAGASAIADALKVNKSLTMIDLWNNNIAATGASAIAEALKVNKSLTMIELGGNNIADTGVKAIADALKDNKSLTEIYLWDNNITDVGAQYLIEALNSNQTLTYINLDNNKISSELKTQIEELLNRNKVLRSIHSSSEENYLKSNSVKTFADTKDHDVNAPLTASGTTSLMIAVQQNNLDLAKLFLSKKNINIDIQDNFGNTALHYATKYFNPELFALLIARGANTAIKNKAGKSVIDLVLEECQRRNDFTFYTQLENIIKDRQKELASRNLSVLIEKNNHSERSAAYTKLKLITQIKELSEEDVLENIKQSISNYLTASGAIKSAIPTTILGDLLQNKIIEPSKLLRPKSTWTLTERAFSKSDNDPALSNITALITEIDNATTQIRGQVHDEDLKNFLVHKLGTIKTFYETYKATYKSAPSSDRDYQISSKPFLISANPEIGKRYLKRTAAMEIRASDMIEQKSSSANLRRMTLGKPDESVIKLVPFKEDSLIKAAEFLSISLENIIRGREADNAELLKISNLEPVNKEENKDGRESSSNSSKRYLAFCTFNNQEIFTINSPELIIIKWLAVLNQKDHEYLLLLKNNIISTNEYNNLKLPITLSSKTISEIYKKLKLIQSSTTRSEADYQEVIKLVSANNQNQLIQAAAESFTGLIDYSEFSKEGERLLQTEILKLSFITNLTLKNSESLDGDRLLEILASRFDEKSRIQTLHIKGINNLTIKDLKNALTANPELIINIEPNYGKISVENLLGLAERFNRNEKVRLNIIINDNVIPINEIGQLSQFDYLVKKKFFDKDLYNQLIQKHVKFDHNIFYLACASDNVEMVKFFLDNGANVARLDEDGKSPLHAAMIKKGNYEVAKLLIERGASVNHFDKDGDTALDKAIKSGNRKLADLLLSYGGRSNSLIKKHTAEELLKTLIDNNIFDEEFYDQILKEKEFSIKDHAFTTGLSVETMTFLHIVAASDDEQSLKIANYLIRRGVNVVVIDKRSSTALHIAARNSNHKMVEYLIAKAKEHFEAQQKNQEEKKEIAVKISGEPVIGSASSASSLIEFLNIADKKGNNALDKALEAKAKDKTNNSLNTIAVLLANGADKTKSPQNLETAKAELEAYQQNQEAQRAAAAVLNEQSSKYLVVPDIYEEKESKFHSPRSYSPNNSASPEAILRNTEILRQMFIEETFTQDKFITLLEQGIDINHNFGDERNPGCLMHFAVMTNNLEAIELLHQYGADVNIKNSKGSTPLDIVCNRNKFNKNTENHKATINLLRSLGAKSEIADKSSKQLYEELSKFLSEALLYGKEPADFESLNENKNITKDQIKLKGTIDKMYGDIQARLAYLMLKGADVNYRSETNGNTLLHQACSYGNKTMIAILYNILKANQNIRNNTGQLPIDLVKNERLRGEIQELLMDEVVVVSDIAASNSSSSISSLSSSSISTTNSNPSPSPTNTVAAARLSENMERERS